MVKSSIQKQNNVENIHIFKIEITKSFMMAFVSDKARCTTKRTMTNLKSCGIAINNPHINICSSTFHYAIGLQYCSNLYQAVAEKFRSPQGSVQAV